MACFKENDEWKKNSLPYYHYWAVHLDCWSNQEIAVRTRITTRTVRIKHTCTFFYAGILLLPITTTTTVLVMSTYRWPVGAVKIMKKKKTVRIFACTHPRVRPSLPLFGGGAQGKRPRRTNLLPVPPYWLAGYDPVL